MSLSWMLAKWKGDAKSIVAINWFSDGAQTVAAEHINKGKCMKHIS